MAQRQQMIQQQQQAGYSGGGMYAQPMYGRPDMACACWPLPAELMKQTDGVLATATAEWAAAPWRCP